MDFKGGFDDPLQKHAYEQAHQMAQANAGIDDLAETLGTFRRGLIAQGFSKRGAERIAQEFYLSIVDAAAVQASGGDDGDGD